MLALQQVNSGYGRAKILHGISLNVSEGEIVCLLGNNGAGKTTTLLTILNILTPRSGTVEFMGEPLNGLRPAEIVRRGIAVVPEGRRIFGSLTVDENLQIGAAIRNTPREAMEDTEMVFGLFPILKERRHQLGGTLSGGQQQMLAIARALMTRPRLILMDEPSMGLSPVLSEQVFDIIKTIRDRGVSVLLVEQNAYASLAVATRGYVMQAGQIAVQGAAGDLRQAELVKEAYL
ncbi:MAG: ABC transporter ATP-binding protein [Acidimicrobiia bacterium]|nr:ABC transporter ATP-binding protein [Acidimicrobiia bacterium]